MLSLDIKDIFGELGVERGRFCIEYAKDNNGRRASLIAYNNPDAWLEHELLDDPLVKRQIAYIQQKTHDHNEVNADAVLQAAWENYHIAKQNGNIAASNAALVIVAKHSQVDAFAAEKVALSTDEDRVAMLMRARKRGNAIDGEVVEDLSLTDQTVEESFL